MLQHGRLDETASPFTDGSALSPSHHSLRFQPSRPEAWPRGWQGLSRHYHNERKYRNSHTAPEMQMIVKPYAGELQVRF